MPRLDIRICGARGLPNLESFGTIDPYCTVNFEGKQWRTNVAEDTTEPQWNEVFKFNVSDENSSRLHFVIWDDEAFSDEFLGEYYMSISGLDRGVVDDKWVLLQNCKGNGELHVRLMAVDFGDVPEPETPPAPVYRPLPQTYAPPPEQQQYYRPLAPAPPPMAYPQQYQQPVPQWQPEEPEAPPQPPKFRAPMQLDRLLGGQKLRKGESRSSGNRRIKLVHQGDGNVVLYRGRQALWSTGTNGNETTHFVFQRDGNAVLYNRQDVLWASNTNDSGANRMVVQDDGNLVIYNDDGAVWASDSCQEDDGPQDTLGEERTLEQDDFIRSNSGRFTFVHQGDGNCVIYDGQGGPIWSTNTCGQETDVFKMQGDGNVVLYAPGWQPRWASNTNGSGANRLVMQDDGNLVAYGDDGPKWASNTNVA